MILFPDLNGYDKWKDKAVSLSAITSFSVSDLLEKEATEQEKIQGLDLADYLVRFDLKEFISIPVIKQQTEINNYRLPAIQTGSQVLENWEKEINELENYFASISFPKQAIKFNSYCSILDTSKFVDAHLSVVRTNNGKPGFLPYLERLQELRNILAERSICY